MLDHYARRQVVPAACAVAVLLSMSTAAGHLEPAKQDLDQVSAGTLLAKLGEYVAKFEREFSSAVAEERYVQLIRPMDGLPSWPPREQALEWHDGKDYPKTGIVSERRQLLSDVLLVHTAQGWIGYRDVAEVDGRAVRQRGDRVANLFLSREANRNDQLRRIARESARYNIGGFNRTLNIPTLLLYFMRARNHSRFNFTSAGREQLGEQSTDVIRYEEHQRPTLITNQSGDDVPISGRLWIDADSGEVVQTEINFVSGERYASRRGMLVTRYRRDPRFAVLIPDYMWEWYEGGVLNVFGPAIKAVEGLARYTNYRKFAVSTTEISR